MTNKGQIYCRREEDSEVNLREDFEANLTFSCLWKIVQLEMLKIQRNKECHEEKELIQIQFTS